MAAVCRRSISALLRQQIFSKRNFLDVRWHSQQTSRLMTIKEARTVLMNMVGTKDMWGDLSERSKTLAPIADSQNQLVPKPMSASFQEIIIPVGSDERVRGRYVTTLKGIRFGRILEDLDTFAGLICYTHNLDPSLGADQKSPLSTVTALVDRIELKSMNISPYHDVRMSGQVTWVGTSSMEVTMKLHQDQGSGQKELLTAKFVMVARNPITKKAAPVSPLKPEGSEEQKLFKEGEAAKLLRQEEARKSLLKTIPSPEETKLVHDLFLQTVDLQSGTFKVRVKPKNSVWMEETVLKNLIICHPEERNLYNKIFGGFLMRQAYELAWANATMYCHTRPTLKVVDDIIFRKPVEIGSLLFLSSQVVFTVGNMLEIKVHAEVVDPSTGSHDTTNDFHFTFDSGDSNLPQVIPKTYAESMLYLDGKRHYTG